MPIELKRSTTSVASPPHALTHEEGGSDEINLDGLQGTPLIINGQPEMSVFDEEVVGGHRSLIDNAVGDVPQASDGFIEGEQFGVEFDLLSGTASAEFDSDVPRTGRFTLRINAPSSSSAVCALPKNSPSIVDLANFPIGSNQKFKITLPIKTENVGTDAVYFDLLQYDDDGIAGTLIESNKFSGDSVFSLAFAEFTTDIDAAYIRIRCHNLGNTSESNAWFDLNSLKIEKVEEVTGIDASVSQALQGLEGRVRESILISQNIHSAAQNIFAGEKIGQKFTVTEDGVISKISQYISLGGIGAGNLTMRVYEWNTDYATTVAGSVVAESTLNNGFHVSGTTYYDFIIPFLVTSIVYFFELEASGGDVGNYYGIVRQGSGNPYAGGSFWINGVEAVDMDARFQIFFSKNSKNISVSVNGVETKYEKELLKGMIVDFKNNKIIYSPQEAGNYLVDVFETDVIDERQLFYNTGTEFYHSVLGINSGSYFTQKFDLDYNVGKIKIAGELFWINAEFSLDNTNWETLLDESSGVSTTYEVNKEINGKLFYVRFTKTNLSATARIGRTATGPYHIEMDIIDSIPRGLTYPTFEVISDTLVGILAIPADRIEFDATTYENPSVVFKNGSNVVLLQSLPYGKWADIMELIIDEAGDNTTPATLTHGQQFLFTADDVIPVSYGVSMDYNSIYTSVNEDSKEVKITYKTIWESISTQITNLHGRIKKIEEISKSKIPSNDVTVYSSSDLPEPLDLNDGIGMAHRLEAGKNYRIDGFVQISFPISFSGSNPTGSIALWGPGELKYTGTGKMFRANANANVLSFGVFFLELNGNNTADLFDVQGVAFLNLFFSGCSDFLELGDVIGIGSPSGFFSIDRSILSGFTKKLNISGFAINYFIGAAFTYSAPISDSIIRISGTMTSTVFQNCQFIPLAGDSAFDFDSALIGFVNISITNVIDDYGGIQFKAGSLDYSDPNIRCHHNGKIPNSVVTASITLQDNTSETVVRNTNEWRTVAGITVERYLERVVMTNDSELTFTNLEEQRGSIDVFFGANVTGGGTKDLEFSIFKNTGDVGSITAFVDAGGGLVTITSASHGLSDDEYIKIVGAVSAGYNSDFIVSNVTLNTFDVELVFVADDATGSWFEMAIVDGSAMPRQTSATAGSVAVKASISSVAGDIFDVRTMNTSDSTNIIVSTMQLGALFAS